MHLLLLHPTVLLGVLFALLPTSSPAAQTASDAKEIEAYRLTLPALKKVVAVNRALVGELMKDPKFLQSQKLRRELEALQDKDDLSAGEQKRMDELETRLRELETGAIDPLGGDTKSLSEMEARITKYPAMVQALARENMSPREYATFWLAFVQAAFVHGFQKAGMLKELPPGVNPENVRFIGEHAAEIENMQKELEAIGGLQP